MLPSFERAAAALLVILAGCGKRPAPAAGTPGAVPSAAAQDPLPFAFVDVAAEMGYTLRNHTGKDANKDFIVEAMPPGIAPADFDGDGYIDLYCANGNLVVAYDERTKTVTWKEGPDAPRNELYWNEGGKRLRPGGKEAGVDDWRWAFGSVAGDLDNDGDPDLYVCNWGPNRLYLNDGTGHFKEVARRLGAAGNPMDWSTGACMIDYDKDGDLDIYVAQYADMAAFLENRANVKVLVGGKLFGRTCEWKKLKVYCGPIGLRPLNDILLENQLMQTGKLEFKDVTKERGIWFRTTPRSYTDNSAGPYYGFQPVSWDIDEDGWPDIFVTNDSVSNLCWINKGGKRFEDTAQAMGLAMSASDYNPQASMGVAVGDLDNDGRFDLIVSEFSHDQSNLLTAERLPNGMVVFNERAVKTGFRDLTFFKLQWGNALYDMDLDGDLDMYICCGHVYPEVDQFKDQQTSYRQTNLCVLNADPKRLKLEDVSNRAGPGLRVAKVSRAAVAVDLDNDGDMDIVTSELNDRPTLLRLDIDRSRDKNHWLMIHLVGDPEAKIPMDPVGTVVKVTAGKLQMSRVRMIGSSFQSCEDPRLHFGLGPNAVADRIEIRWPNGKTTVLQHVAADRHIEIRYGANG